MYKERSYRKWVRAEDLVTFEVVEKETDLLISAAKELKREAREAVLSYRRDLESYIKQNPLFYTSLEPIDVKIDAPAIVKAMAGAAKSAGVGPMAAVAGAMAQLAVEAGLEAGAEEAIVDNGGDIYLKTTGPVVIGLFPGGSGKIGRLAFSLQASDTPLSICSSCRQHLRVPVP